MNWPCHYWLPSAATWVNWVIIKVVPFYSKGNCWFLDVKLIQSHARRFLCHFLGCASFEIVLSTLNMYSSGSSGRVREAGEKHEIYGAAFGSHHFMPPLLPDPLLKPTYFIFLICFCFLGFKRRTNWYLLVVFASENCQSSLVISNKKQ